MPLSKEDQALFDRAWRQGSGDPRATFTEALRRLLNACRLEERAKAEGEVEELKRERDEALAALDKNWVQHQRVVAAESNLAKAEARIAELTQEGEALKADLHTALREAVNYAREAGEMAVKAEAALSRATQAEELVREVTGVLEPFAHVIERFDRGGRSGPMGGPLGPAPGSECVGGIRAGWLRAAAALSAKLKAAPLQGGGSSSVSSVESAARLASQVCDQDRSTPLEGGDL